MRKKNCMPFLGMALMTLLIAATLLLAAFHGAKAEMLPILSGDFRLTCAEADIRVAAYLRVDVLRADAEEAWADLTLPKLPRDLSDVMLFDGWHILHGRWEQTGENTLRIRFRQVDLRLLDGTVGIYLVLLKGENH